MGSEGHLRIAFVGRLTGPKGMLARGLLHEVCPRFPTVEFVFAGGPLTQDILTLAGANVVCCGWIADLGRFMQSVDLVIGSGRVALEAMQAGVPLLAAGEAQYLGYIDRENFLEARYTNFGDCNYGAYHDFAALSADIARFLEGYRPEVAEYRALLAEYSGERVASAVHLVYTEAWLSRRLARRSVPILCYHRVVTELPKDSRVNIYVTKDGLSAQLAQLRRRRFTPITFTDLLAPQPLPKHPIILTFDDGYRDNYEHLLPLLDDFRARAVIFVLGDRSLKSNSWDSAIGEPEAMLMSNAQLRECHSTGLVEIGAHGYSHRHLPGLSDDELGQELAGSKQAVEAVLGTPIHSFAYPYGAFGDRERKSVAAAGFSFGLATDRGVPLCRDRYAVARRLIFPATGGFGFYKKTTSWYPRYRHALGRPA